MKIRIYKTLLSAAIILSFGTVESKAIGDRELGALMGIGGLMIFNNITSHNSVRHNSKQIPSRYENRYEERVVYKTIPTYRTNRYEYPTERTYVIENHYYERNHHRKNDRRRDYRGHHNRR